MAKLNIKDVEHVAKLAKLSISSKEVSLYQTQLSSVIDYVKNLSEVDTSNTTPTSQTTGLTDVCRNDEVICANEIKKEGYFEIDKLIDK
ncbi:Asp-tRNA(Asn)/Glu-tRNA(Gln) amidotransferase subunit GatC [Patescibacteria group bacterium]